MLKFLALISFLAVAASAFNIEEFLQKHCKDTPEEYSLACENVNFSEMELSEIQKEKFVISQAAKIIFNNTNLGVFNENFVNKFPNATCIKIFGSSLSFNSSKIEGSEANNKLEKLSIVESEIYGNANSTALNHLHGLKSFKLVCPKSVEYPCIDEHLFQENKELTAVKINGK